MALALNDKVLTEAFGPSEGTALRVKQAVMVILGIAALAIFVIAHRLVVPPQRRCWQRLRHPTSTRTS